MNKKISQLAVAALFSLAAVSANAACIGSRVISTSVTQPSVSSLCDVSITSTGTVGGFFAIDLSNSENVTLNNAGVIAGLYGVYMSNGAVTTINNTGTFSSTNLGIFNGGTITTINNTGTISSPMGVNNRATITTLNNLQGASGSALKLTGNLPNNYNIIINSSTDFGQLNAQGSGGSMSFGIIDGSTITANTIYNNVLTGIDGSSDGSSITGLQTVTGATGVFNGLNYSLTANSITAGGWDLVVGSSVNPVPEADTSAMLLMGAGLMGFIAHRRRNTQA